MRDVDISDKLRNYHMMDIWVRNRKWWWSILFWAIGVILKNAYIIYVCIHNRHGTPRKHRLSHHDFRTLIACAWINPEKYSTEEFEIQP